MAKKKQNIETFEFETPAAKSNRMNWSPSDFPATEVEEVEVLMSKTGKPYMKLHFADKPIVACLVEQMLADTGDKFVVSEEGEPIEVDLAVSIGVKDGAFFASV